MKTVLSICSFLLLLSCASKRTAVTTPTNNTAKIYVDRLDNIYVLSEHSEIQRLDTLGNEMFAFSSRLDGVITHIDVTNPQKIIAYIPDFGKILLLDNTLSLIRSWTIDPVQFSDVRTVASSNEGNYWIYDQPNWRLLKIDDEGQILTESNRLTDFNLASFSPVYMVERENKVFVSTDHNSVLIFDNFGKFIKEVPLEGIEKFDVRGDQIYYRKGNEIMFFNMVLLETIGMDIPVREKTVKDVALIGNKAIFLTENGLEIR